VEWIESVWHFGGPFATISVDPDVWWLQNWRSLPSWTFVVQRLRLPGSSRSGQMHLAPQHVFWWFKVNHLLLHCVFWWFLMVFWWSLATAALFFLMDDSDSNDLTKTWATWALMSNEFWFLRSASGESLTDQWKGGTGRFGHSLWCGKTPQKGSSGNGQNTL